jgi:dihydropyrimidinase
MLHHEADYTPYEGLEITGWPTTIVLGGPCTVENSIMNESKSCGEYLVRNRSSVTASA